MREIEVMEKEAESEDTKEEIDMGEMGNMRTQREREVNLLYKKASFSSSTTRCDR
jgi:hypothetical protein